MAYATGSGTYIDLMAAVLAFANLDGWTLTGGTWPISKGNVRGVDWDSYTAAANDHTNGGAAKTIRYGRLAIGTSPADATANVTGGSAPVIPNMEYAIDQWFIFSDPSVGNFIHVVFQFANGPDAQVYQHFSFGEIDKHGMGYTGIAYAATNPMRGFNVGNFVNSNSGYDHNAGAYARFHRIFTGRLGYSSSDYFVGPTSVLWIADPTISPFPVDGLWPLADGLYDHARLLDTYGHGSTSFNTNSTTNLGQNNCKMVNQALWHSSQPYSGGVTLAPLPFFVADRTGNSTLLKFMALGSFPAVRLCSMDTFLPGDEVTYGADTWKLFPMLCKKDRGILDNTANSAQVGFAYKKVI